MKYLLILVLLIGSGSKILANSIVDDIARIKQDKKVSTNLLTLMIDHNREKLNTSAWGLCVAARTSGDRNAATTCRTHHVNSFIWAFCVAAGNTPQACKAHERRNFGWALCTTQHSPQQCASFDNNPSGNMNNAINGTKDLSWGLCVASGVAPITCNITQPANGKIILE